MGWRIFRTRGRRLGPWTGTDDVPPSSDAPRGFTPGAVPQLVSIGFDDNQRAEGIDWVCGLLRDRRNPGMPGTGVADGEPVRATFYVTAIYGGKRAVRRAWRRAYRDGHEIGVHTVTHPDGLAFDEAAWRPEIAGCIEFVRDVVRVPEREILGFRAPYLKYNGAAFSALAALGLRYDCSIQDGFEPAHDGTNYVWPYTLDRGSPGDDQLRARNDPAVGSRPPIGAHAGLWELPVHPVIVPPDADCERYGVPPGFRARMKTAQAHIFDVGDGKAPGLDYNLWFEFGMTAAELLATLKHTLDLRLRGNRAPFAFGAHADYYAQGGPEPPRASLGDRRRALQEFVAYALAQPAVRFVPHRAILDIVRTRTAPAS